jgi:putative transposase
VTRSRELVAKGHRPATVARVMQISRQAIYRTPVRRPQGAGPGRPGADDEVIVEVAKANPTDGTRMVAAISSRELGRAVNRKRAQRVMRTHKLLQRSRNTDRRRRPGYFRVRRPDELWHMDMTKVWTASHGWVYLHAIVDCCTRELAGWSLDLRCRDDEAIAAVEAAVIARGVGAGVLSLGTDIQAQSRSSGPWIVRPAAQGSRRAGARPPSLGLRPERSHATPCLLITRWVGEPPGVARPVGNPVTGQLLSVRIPIGECPVRLLPVRRRDAGGCEAEGGACNCA